VVWLCGVDGFKEKWRAVLGNFTTGEVRLLDRPLNEILDLPERPAIITVDVPIGLPEVTLPGGRTSDRLARHLLGARSRSVFSPIGRICLPMDDREKASRLSIKRGGNGECAQFASLARTALVGAPLPRASSPGNLDLTDRLTVDLGLATPHTLSRRCAGLSLNEAWIASPSSLVPNSDFQK
jgi:hypothetical protein